MTSQDELLAHLHRAFPFEPFGGVVAAHECLECDELRGKFGGKGWEEISSEVLDEHFDCLPLLTPDAYVAFLPAWMRDAIADPEGLVSSLALINLESSDHVGLFSREQRFAILECARFAYNHDGSASPADMEWAARLVAIERKWRP